jgi:hypothetical protein
MSDDVLDGRRPGPVVLFGSGETSPSGRKVFDQLLSELPMMPRLALLETPAGFELNSERVIGRVADFLSHHLQNYKPQITEVPARKRGTAFSPDNPQLVAPLLQADLIFMGPGSPTYAVRQLRHSLAWRYLLARHRLGATLVLASAATIAFSAYALPVYEIYKVGEELHWKDGLDFFGLAGLPLVFIPHWNNNDGGAELDTSRCFMGVSRFTRLMELLPPYITVLGIDEKTALILDIAVGEARVAGLGGVTIIHTGHSHDRTETGDSADIQQVAELRKGHTHRYNNGERFPLSECCLFDLPLEGRGLPPEVWQMALDADENLQAERRASPTDIPPPDEVLELLKQRQSARADKDWARADRLRDEIIRFGWEVKDTPDGPQVEKMGL